MSELNRLHFHNNGRLKTENRKKMTIRDVFADVECVQLFVHACFLAVLIRTNKTDRLA